MRKIAKDMSYEAVLSRQNEILSHSLGIDYSSFNTGTISFDYERLMDETAYCFDDVVQIQKNGAIGNTPLIELKNITQLVRLTSPQGKGARIFIKDEACNPSGSFKDRRASISVYHAHRSGYPGIIAATSGNYGAAVASQAAMKGLKCIVVQETFDSKGRGQPEILEKGRACEAYGADVLQLSVGPELFYVALRLLEETGYFNGSLYTPFSILGVETLGFELIHDVRKVAGRDPDVVVITHAGGGNVTGTTRGIQRAGSSNTQIVAASVDLAGLHMASDVDFNKKSFTTGHTGFGVPFVTKPNRSDVPISAARPLRYMDRYVTVTQGEVFYVTEMLAKTEGLQRGPAGNISLAAAVDLARNMDQDQIVVVQETEYTGAGKLPATQLTFAKKMGIELSRGDPQENEPGKKIVIPMDVSQIRVVDLDLNNLRKHYVRNALDGITPHSLTSKDLEFLEVETKTNSTFVSATIAEMGASVEELLA